MTTLYNYQRQLHGSRLHNYLLLPKVKIGENNYYIRFDNIVIWIHKEIVGYKINIRESTCEVKEYHYNIFNPFSTTFWECYNLFNGNN